MSFMFSRVDPFTLRCTITGTLTAGDTHQITEFLQTHDDKLLVDLSGARLEDGRLPLWADRSPSCRVACYGASLRGCFSSEEEAVMWLRTEQYLPDPDLLPAQPAPALIRVEAEAAIEPV